MRLGFWLGILSLAMLLNGTNAVAATPDEVENAIAKGVAYLYGSRNKHGNWEESQTRPVGATGGGSDFGQWGGRTSLCTYALLSAGEKPLDPRIVLATDFLRKAQLTGHYAIGLRANVWLKLPFTDENRAALLADRQLLVTGISNLQPNKGFYDYQPDSTRIDLSCSQYGVLGAWAAAQRLINSDATSKAFWQKVETAWREHQGADGSWDYNGTGNTGTLQMTAAGVATLFITQDFLHSDDGIDGMRGNIEDRNISKGLDWISENFKELFEARNGSRLYTFYGIERIGAASGYKYFGSIDWYQDGAEWLVRNQDPVTGGWGERGIMSDDENTAFAVLFLSRGRAPVMINKLQYSLMDPADNSKRNANWNQRPRDVARVTRWVSDKTERTLNWQILNLNVATIDDLHDSTICYMTGNQPISIPAEQVELLKKFIEEGGMLIGSADNASPQFNMGFRELGKRLFPEYSFEAIHEKKSDTLLYGQAFSAANWKRRPEMYALSNGARPLMILIPTDDFSKTLQRGLATRSEVFEFFADAFLFSVDKTDARFKGQKYEVPLNNSNEPKTTVPIARIVHDGNSDPEPAGWRRLAAILNNKDQVALDVKSVELKAADSLAGYKIAHLTGTKNVTFLPVQRDAIRQFIVDGGLLIVDACGGSPEFDAAVSTELSKILPADNIPAQLADPIRKDHPLLADTSVDPIDVKYRVFAMQKLGAAANRVRVRQIVSNGKLAVLYSPEDISVGLVGMPIDGITGYDPDTATLLMRRMILLKNAGRL